MYTDKENLLAEVKKLLLGELSSISYSTWIKPMEIASINDNKIVLLVQTDMQKDALISRLLDLLQTSFNFITNKQCEIKIYTKDEYTKDKENESV